MDSGVLLSVCVSSGSRRSCRSYLTASASTGNFPAATNTVNATLLMQEFRCQLDQLGKTNGKHYLLTPLGKRIFRTSNLLPSVARSVTTVQGYDFHRDWEMASNDASPLFDGKQDPVYGENFYIDYTMTWYRKAGVPAEKLGFGIPAYGYGWPGVPDINNGRYQPATDFLETQGVATYLTVSSLTGYTRHFNPVRIAVWRYQPSTGAFWTY